MDAHLSRMSKSGMASLKAFPQCLTLKYAERLGTRDRKLLDADCGKKRESVFFILEVTDMMHFH